MATASFLSIARSVLRPGAALQPPDSLLLPCTAFQAQYLTSLLVHGQDECRLGLLQGFPLPEQSHVQIVKSRVHAGALPFLRDPYDMDNEEPFGQLMTAPMREQMVRVAGAFAVMACLAVACIHVPIRAATALAPALFPLRLKLVDALAELPADLLLFHVCLPLTLPHLHLRHALLPCVPHPCCAVRVIPCLVLEEIAEIIHGNPPLVLFSSALTA